MSLMLVPDDDEPTVPFDTVVVDLPMPGEQWRSDQGATVIILWLIEDTVVFRYPGQERPWDAKLDTFLRRYSRV